MTTSLVTGATSGIGREFVNQLAGRGSHLVLVARDAVRLDQVAGEVREAYGVHVDVLVADLGDRADLQRVADRLADPDHPIDILVNNAGHGLKRPYLANEIAVEEQLLDVLCRAVLVLSHAAARAMRGRDRGRIINVSSVAGFLPGGTYSAAKAYVTTLTEALAGSLAGSRVTATVVCPGFVHTEFHRRADLDRDRIPEFAWLTAAQVVRAALADSDAGRVVSVPSLRYKGVVGLLKFAPRALTRGPRVANRDHRPEPERTRLPS